MKSFKKLANFDPKHLAYYEKENYVAYYRKNWLRLMVVSVSMVKEAYQLSLLQAIYGAYLVARAEIFFAPFPKNNVPETEAYVRRFYRFLAGIYGLDLDLDVVTRLEVNWWIVHRQRFAMQDNQELVHALAALYTIFYRIPEEQALPAAAGRARGMLYSDRWVRGGMEPNSPLLIEEERALCQGYEDLRRALIGLTETGL